MLIFSLENQTSLLLYRLLLSKYSSSLFFFILMLFLVYWWILEIFALDEAFDYILPSVEGQAIEVFVIRSWYLTDGQVSRSQLQLFDADP